MDQTFSSFKQNFYSRINDFSAFDCADFNLLKVVLDGLFVDYAGKSKLFVYIHFPVFFVRIILFLKQIQYKTFGFKLDKEIQTVKDKKIIFRGSFLVKDGQKDYGVFKNICNVLDPNSYCFINDVNLNDKNYQTDVNIAALYNQLVYQPLDKDEIKLLKQLQKTYKSIVENKIFDSHETKNIGFAIQKFFLDYLKWKRVLTYSDAKYFIFRCHYHFEGMLLALKRKGIKAIELQHGLIAEEDIFYVMPKQVSTVADRALFADEIWVYGNSWKNTLLKGGEYSEQKIKIFGYYMANNIVMNNSLQKILDIKKNRKIILVTTQTGLDKEFIEYITWLKKDMFSKNMWNDYIMIIKPHPNESKGIYNSLLDNNNVFLYENDLDSVFNETELLLSVYSTTIIEALRYGINCFSLYTERYKDYIFAFVSKGYSKLVKQEENIINLNEDNSTDNKTEDLFAPLDIPLIQQLT